MKYFLIPMLLYCTACASITYEGKTDGSTKVTILTFGSNQLIKDMNASITPQGIRSVSIGSFDGNESEGMDKANQGLKYAVEGLTEGIVKGLK
jgi:hypothetical protein